MRLPRLTLIAALAVSAASTASTAQAVAASTGLAGVVCSNRAAPPKLAGRPVDLSGVYSWQLGTFYIRQVGTCVYLMGQSNPDANGPAGKGFTSIFIGGITPKLTVKGLWSDVPYGQVTGSGLIVLKITEASGIPTLTVVRSTGGWGANQLVRIHT